ncbi:MoaD/ThiS family protein [Intrasporangium sp. DVR]|uniref:MoaD/ThiS family protein n=1 Tax=Intrasporangium sp. DVR TaxID=3127867 RepID=UPI00333FCEE4
MEPHVERTVTVRYWAAAREGAGVDSEQLPLERGATVSDVVVAAVAAHPALARVADVATFLVDGRAARRDTAVAEGATVEVLPPFAGG